MRSSLRLRLLLLVLGLFTLVWILITTVSFYSAKDEFEELFDAELAQYARTLQSLTAHDSERQGLLDIPTAPYAGGLGHRYEKKIAFQVWRGTTLIARSDTAPAAPLSDRFGFSDVRFSGEGWRVFSLPAGEFPVSVQVAERLDVRDELAAKISLQVLVPLIIALPLLALVGWLAIGGGLRPLRRITGEVAARSPRDLHPLDNRVTPAEISPLVTALNELLDRLRQALARERRFTADAAHELRTPLAALRVQAQVAEGARTEEARHGALRRIRQGVDRGARVVEQLLTLARIDPGAADDGVVPVALAALARDVVAELAPLAVAREIDMGMTTASEHHAAGHPDLLRVLYVNLIDNAIKYTPPGGRVDVAVTADAADCVVTVTDTGPGIAPELRQRVFERFFRLPGHDAEGCGLGLSIARRIVDLHHARIDFDPDYSDGLRVVVRLAAAA